MNTQKVSTIFVSIMLIAGLITTGISAYYAPHPVIQRPYTVSEVDIVYTEDGYGVTQLDPQATITVMNIQYNGTLLTDTIDHAALVDLLADTSCRRMLNSMFAYDIGTTDWEIDMIVGNDPLHVVLGERYSFCYNREYYEIIDPASLRDALQQLYQ